MHPREISRGKEKEQRARDAARRTTKHGCARSNSLFLDTASTEAVQSSS